MKQIPDNYRVGKKPLPAGNSDWADFSQKCYTVDKTLLIKELIDDDIHAVLFTRPRRFGKTTALQMVKTFFEKTEQSNAFLFEDKLIWKAGEHYRALQGIYPVIYLTFKDHKGLTWEQAFFSLCFDISSEICRHKYIFNAHWDNENHKDLLMQAMKSQPSESALTLALGLLAEAIHRYHGVKPIILIDEYDSPINSASVNGYYDKMVNFMRSFLAGALKDNQHYELAILTGVLRVAKEGILSGLNNLSVFTVFDRRYNSYFGFTEDEVRTMAEYYEVPERMEEIRSWYDGYNFAGTEIYNPWSVLQYFLNECEPKPYWLNTSSNDIIREIVNKMPFEIWKTLEYILKQDTPPTVAITQELGSFDQIYKTPEALYALLVSTGYLKPASQINMGRCAVTIPNREITTSFTHDIMDRLRTLSNQSPTLDSLHDSLFRRDAHQFKTLLGKFLQESVSYFDGAAEGFYHGLTLGFLAMLQDQFRVTSNLESGGGRYDIQLKPLFPSFPGVIIEIKAADSSTENLEDLANSARKQIEINKYDTAMKADGINEILCFGLAFFKKEVAVVQ